MTLFVSYFVPPCDVNEGILFFSGCASCFVYLSLHFTLTFSFHREKKSECDKINLALSVISIITILVKLFQMIQGCYSFCGVSVCLSVYLVSAFIFKKYVFLIRMASMSLRTRFRGWGNWKGTFQEKEALFLRFISFKLNIVEVFMWKCHF